METEIVAGEGAPGWRPPFSPSSMCILSRLSACFSLLLLLLSHFSCV